MSSKTEQLIAKALSTTSEDEAIACLRMARKHNTGGTATQSSERDWEALARKYHKTAYNLQEDLKLVKMQRQIYADVAARHERDAKFAKRQAETISQDMKNRIVYGVIVLLVAVFLSFAIGHAIG